MAAVAVVSRARWACCHGPGGSAAAGPGTGAFNIRRTPLRSRQSSLALRPASCCRGRWLPGPLIRVGEQTRRITVSGGVRVQRPRPYPGPQTPPARNRASASPQHRVRRSSGQPARRPHPGRRQLGQAPPPGLDHLPCRMTKVTTVASGIPLIRISALRQYCTADLAQRCTWH